MEMKLLLVSLSCLLCNSIHNTEAKNAQSSGSFNVKSFGAHADGYNDDSKAFVAAWKAACSSSGRVKLVVPKGTYLLGPVKFLGPCKHVGSFTFHVEGHLKATTDLQAYDKAGGDDWVEFGWVDQLILTGGGTFDGQGAVSWPFNRCPQLKHCKVLPTSIKFVYTTNTQMRSITSLNSKFFHIALVGCKNFWGSQIRIIAPENSPNTDGIHIDRSSGVSIYSSVIGTGDDCISIGQGNSHLTISGIKCGPGHGISVGSLGRYVDEEDVRGLVVRDCTFTGTENGVRIKTWENSPRHTSASNMTFDNIVMRQVANPIIIDQTYCPYASCSSNAPSKVKISDITFRNIRGTSTTAVAVTLKCSKGIPCQNVKLQNIHLKFVGEVASTAMCSNIKAAYSGVQIPPPCS